MQWGRAAAGMKAAFLCRPLNATGPKCDHLIWLPRACRLNPGNPRTQLLLTPARRAIVCAGPLGRGSNKTANGAHARESDAVPQPSAATMHRSASNAASELNAEPPPP
jgi:hypothetical protein